MRVKRGVSHVKRRKSLLRKTKGYRWGRKNIFRKAKQAWIRAGQHAYRHRRLKKRTARALWQVRVNAAAREHGLRYSQFIHQLRQSKIELDRKVLSELAAEYPKIFEAVIKSSK